MNASGPILAYSTSTAGAQILEFTAEKYVQRHASLLRSCDSYGEVLVTDKSQFQCPTIERIHITVGHPELLRVFISTKTPETKLSVFKCYPRLPREFIRNVSKMTYGTSRSPQSRREGSNEQ
ncbi:hypothetical protein VZT92_020939 [Zoarces viviparus]|uniref:Uncharacterized protein n=1 Tax=Zoarces viviparus TaxID=48416 RepID=A0AAW1EFR1_ZOAVI